RANAEVRGQAGEIDFAANRRIAGATTLAVGNVVAIDVRPRELLRRQRRRVIQLREARGLRGHKLVVADAHRRLAVTRKVIDRRHAWREIFPYRQRDVVVGGNVGEPADLRLLPDDALLVVVETQAVV